MSQEHGESSTKSPLLSTQTILCAHASCEPTSDSTYSIFIFPYNLLNFFYIYKYK